jgi:hypothetical protein
MAPEFVDEVNISPTDGAALETNDLIPMFGIAFWYDKPENFMQIRDNMFNIMLSDRDFINIIISEIGTEGDREADKYQTDTGKENGSLREEDSNIPGSPWILSMAYGTENDEKYYFYMASLVVDDLRYSFTFSSSLESEESRAEINNRIKVFEKILNSVRLNPAEGNAV